MAFLLNSSNKKKSVEKKNNSFSREKITLKGIWFHNKKKERKMQAMRKILLMHYTLNDQSCTTKKMLQL